jgi:colanic acid/amylovoran biosynthesis protein
MCKPALSLSYSVKYDGVLGRSLGLPESIVSASGDSQWTAGRISRLLQAKLDYVDHSYGELVRTISSRVTAVKKKAMIQIDEIAAALR